jgi:signal peptidase I
MQPTLDSDDVLVVNKVAKHSSESAVVGKMYIFASPEDPRKLICKRVEAKVSISPAKPSSIYPSGV